jgi:hypothetical protein
MSTNRYTTVTSQSWFSRIRNAFAGIFFGILLIAGSIMLLFWNEGRSVQRYKTLKEGEGMVVSVPASEIQASNDGKLVHLSGTTVTLEPVSDSVLGVSSQGVKLRRQAEMYQWVESSRSEERKKLGGGTETVTHYDYTKEWNSSWVDSSRFQVPEGHQNPASMPIQSDTFMAHPVELGAFTLGGELVSQISGFQPLDISNATLQPQPWMERGSQVSGNQLTVGADPSSPQLGDLRIRFSFVPNQEVSVVALQSATQLLRYQTKAGGTIALLGKGVQTSSALFASAHSSNRMLTWLLRLGGFVLMGLGWTMVFRPLSVLADVLPILGSIVGAGTGLIAFLLSGILSLTTISVAWFYYRPVLGVILLVCAVFLAVKMGGRMKAKKQQTVLS